MLVGRVRERKGGNNDVLTKCEGVAGELTVVGVLQVAYWGLCVTLEEGGRRQGARCDRACMCRMSGRGTCVTSRAHCSCSRRRCRQAIVCTGKTECQPAAINIGAARGTLSYLLIVVHLQNHACVVRYGFLLSQVLLTAGPLTTFSLCIDGSLFSLRRYACLFAPFNRSRFWCRCSSPTAFSNWL